MLHLERDWYCARTTGRDSRAAFYIDRAGVTVYRPVEHRYNPRSRRPDTPRIVSMFPGYVFFSPESPGDFDRVRRAIGVAGILSTWVGNVLQPRLIDASWIGELHRAGPLVIGRKVPFKHGDKVNLLRSKIAEFLGEVEGIDKSGRVVVAVEMLGRRNLVKVSPDMIELVSGGYESPVYRNGLYSGAKP